MGERRGGENEREEVWRGGRDWGREGEEGEKEEGEKNIEENKLSGISKGTNSTRKSPPS